RLTPIQHALRQQFPVRAESADIPLRVSAGSGEWTGLDLPVWTDSLSRDLPFGGIGTVSAGCGSDSLLDLDVSTRIVDARDRQHVVPVDFWRQYRRSSRTLQLSVVLPGLRSGGRDDARCACTGLASPDGGGKRGDRRRLGR